MSTSRPERLNLGSGRNILPGWVNLDRAPLPGVDVVADLGACRHTPLPFANDSIAEMQMSHVLEHVGDTLALMAELHRIARPDAVLTVRVPHGGSDDAWEDPTHDRAYFPGSFGYFSQPYYWRADYGYRGDWQPEEVVLFVPAAEYAAQPLEALRQRIHRERNVVLEMVATLRPVKPIREPKRDLITPPNVVIVPG